jgi:ribonuclease HII
MSLGVGYIGTNYLAGPIVACAYMDDEHFSMGKVGVRYIDNTNSVAASLQAGANAVMAFKHEYEDVKISKLKVEGIFGLNVGIPCEALLNRPVSQFPLIMSAKIKAAHHMDEIMQRYHERFPEWGFDEHGGQPTVAHKALIKTRKEGSKVHRRSFNPLARYTFTSSRKLDRADMKSKKRGQGQRRWT